MLTELKYLPVNWVNGMKISENHLKQMELANTDQIRDANAIKINNFNFGLLPPVPGSKSSFDLKFSVDPSKLINVALSECRAITPAGVRVDITNKSAGSNSIPSRQLEASYRVKNQVTSQYEVVLIVDPFTRIPAGNPDPQEMPLRYPYTFSDCRIEIIPTEQVNQQIPSAYNITLGKIEVNETDIFLNESYIPPCASVNSFQPLQDQYEKLGKSLFALCTSTEAIIKKVKSQEVKSSLANDVMYISEHVTFFVAQNIANFRWSISEAAPIVMFERFSSLGKVIQVSINSLPDKHKEELFYYLKQWIDLTQAQFEGIVEEMTRLSYNHLDIAGYLNVIGNFMEVTNILFGKLSRIGYIGEQKDTGIVIGETRNPGRMEKDKQSKPFSFLKD